MPKSVSIQIDDRCFERLLDIIDGKVVLDKEEKKIMVNAYRERIANCREMYKRMVLGIDKKKKLDFK